MNYPWYKEIDSGLVQGDLIPECPIIIPPENLSDNSEYEFDIEKLDVIVLSQSCDIENSKIRNVLVCPYYPIPDYFASHPDNMNSEKSQIKEIKKLGEGNQPGYHLLNKQIDILTECQVVDFKNVYAVNIKFLRNYINSLSPRYRMNSPYREHLSQAFARFMMRVGLPQSIDCFNK